MASYTAISVGGNWSSNVTWGGGGHPVAGDTAIINATMVGTVTIDVASACEVLNLNGNGGTLAFSNSLLTLGASNTGSIILGGTTTAATGGIKLTGTTTLDSGATSGTFAGVLQFAKTAGVFTLGTGHSWVNTGLVTFSNTTTVNSPGTETLTCNGGMTVSAGVARGTTKFIFGNGTYTVTSAAFQANVDIVSSGTVTFPTGNFRYNTGTLTHISGTTSVNSGCVLYIEDNVTLTTITGANSIVFAKMTLSTSKTVTLGSNMRISGLLTTLASGGATITFSGGYDFRCDAFTLQSYVSAMSLIFPASQTFTVDTTLIINGSSAYACTVAVPSGTTAFNLVFSGAASACQIYSTTFTYVNASGSAQGLDNWYGGTLTGTTNITNRTSADIGGGTSTPGWFAGE